jgi:hypothetical protein
LFVKDTYRMYVYESSETGSAEAGEAS